jgi:hypothetical protein
VAGLIRAGAALAALALAWGVLLLAAAIWLPVAATQSCTTTAQGDGECRSSGVVDQTLMDQEGYWALVLISPPAIAALAVLALLGTLARKNPWARFLVWGVVVLLWVYTLLTGLSFGLWLFPAAMLLLLAAGVAEASAQVRQAP